MLFHLMYHLIVFKSDKHQKKIAAEIHDLMLTNSLQSHERSTSTYCLEWQQSCIPALFRLSLMNTKQVCFRVSLVSTPRIALEWFADNPGKNITSLKVNSVKLKYFPKIKGSNSLKTIFKSVF
jgi:hypothetical protein